MTFHIISVVYKNPYIEHFPLPPSSVQCLNSAYSFQQHGPDTSLVSALPWTHSRCL